MASAQVTLRRLILYVLLFALVVIAAIGLTGLLGRLFTTGAALVTTDVAGVARALAFAMVGGPLAALLWWFVWKRLDDEADRAAVGWGLYLAGMYAASLVLFTTSVLSAAASFVGGRDTNWSSPLATALVWSGIWVWHRWLWRHPRKGPSSLAEVPVVVGWVFGLLLGAGAAITAFAGLLDVALRDFTSLTPAAERWWEPIVRSVLWAVGGSLVWWWHWIQTRGSKLRGSLTDVALVGVGIFAAGITALGGAGLVLFVLLGLAFNSTEPLNEMLAPLGPALSAAGIGALVWRYYRLSGANRSVATRRAGVLVTSGVALTAAASGVGVIINATLAIAASPLTGDSTRSLLLGGISSLIVGGPVWWFAWKPGRQPETAAMLPSGRRIYLIAIFGVSAVVALIALLLIGYRLFEYALGDVSGESLVDRIRASLGLLVATGLVAAYHFSLWHRERALLAEVSPAQTRTIGRVTLVTGSCVEELSHAITETCGARVVLWKRADNGSDGVLAAGALPDAAKLVERVKEELSGVTAKHILLVVGQQTGSSTHVEVIPLETDSV